jgi:acyl dehydratase
MIDHKFIGYRQPPFAADIEKGRLRLFAKAIGETDPIYSDELAARAAGHPSLPVPPTFFFCLEMERADPYDWFKELGIPLGQVLHGEQSFTYQRTAYAGETLTFSAELLDIYEKKNGALQFLVQRNFVSDAAGAPVAQFDRTIVIRWS